MAYYCLKCKRNHVRGEVFEAHQIYQEKYCLEITEEMKQDPWSETCFDCISHDNYFGIHQCELIKKDFEKYYPELSARKPSYTLQMPKSCFRLPRTSEIYRKCPYWQKDESKEKTAARAGEVSS